MFGIGERQTVMFKNVLNALEHLFESVYSDFVPLPLFQFLQIPDG